ncbi:MAG TPA: DUF411 domain-containing protein [Vicinamibacterales bacterium]|nr:DUF411 domain-containing protein [Vicinamibacterales bacterium]
MDTALTRRSLLTGLVAGVAAIAGGSRLFGAQQKPSMTVYKDASCGCCQHWVNYMQTKGYRSAVHNVDLAPIKAQYGINANLESCHTTLVAGYIIEGHVPEVDIARLLKEKPAGVAGLTIPGMPASAPGMDGRPFQPYTVLAFDKAGKTTVYARHTAPE